MLKALERIEQRTQADPRCRFTALAHHLAEEFLLETWQHLNRRGAPGVDRQTADAYAERLSEHLRPLVAGMKRRVYHAPPVRRVWIPKAGNPTQLRVPGDRWVTHGTWRGPLWRLGVTGHGPVDWPDAVWHKANPLRGRLVVSEDPGLPREPGYLFPSLTRWTAAQVRHAYAHSFQLEESFKDTQNDGGDGGHLAHVRLGTPARWDRLLLIRAWAYWWWTLAGWWAEPQGLDQAWRANTVATRTHALWRLGYGVLHTTALRWRTLLRQAASF